MNAARSSNNDGERIAGLEAKFDGYEKYSHDRWHDLANTLQPLVSLPSVMARDMAKMEGRLEAKIDGRLTAIENRLFAIEGQRQQLTGARKIGEFALQTLISALAALAAIAALWRHP